MKLILPMSEWRAFIDAMCKLLRSQQLLDRPMESDQYGHKAYTRALYGVCSKGRENT